MRQNNKIERRYSALRFAVITNKDRDCDLSVTENTVAYLSSFGSECLLSSSPESAEKIIPECDAAITVGGDGTILGIADIAAKNGCPVIGVNKGTLGYLAEVEPDSLNELSRLISGDYIVEDRMMLKATVETSDGICEYFALNDIVATHDSILRLMNFDLFCDGFSVAQYRSDGLIFSTPTGSTAYSLSAGGPVVDPAHRAIIVTPVCAHTLTARPILFRDDASLSVRCYSKDSGCVRLYCDGGEGVCLADGADVKISRSPFSLKLIRFGMNSFYNILSKKLH